MQKYEVVRVSVTPEKTLKFTQEFVPKDWMSEAGEWVRLDCYKEARAVTDDKNKLLHRLQRNVSVVERYRMCMLRAHEVDASVKTYVGVRKDGTLYCTSYSSGSMDKDAVAVELDQLMISGKEYTTRTYEGVGDQFVQEVYKHILDDAEPT